MKRVVTGATNKKASLDEIASHLKETEFQSDRFKCVSNVSENTVDVYERIGQDALDNLVARYTLNTEKSKTKRYRYRRATPEDNASGTPLYVKESYESVIEKQVPSIKRVDSIAHRYDGLNIDIDNKSKNSDDADNSEDSENVENIDDSDDSE